MTTFPISKRQKADTNATNTKSSAKRRRFKLTFNKSPFKKVPISRAVSLPDQTTCTQPVTEPATLSPSAAPAPLLLHTSHTHSQTTRDHHHVPSHEYAISQNSISCSDTVQSAATKSLIPSTQCSAHSLQSKCMYRYTSPSPPVACCALSVKGYVCHYHHKVAAFKDKIEREYGDRKCPTQSMFGM